jgi:hypothetical protein
MPVPPSAAGSAAGTMNSNEPCAAWVVVVRSVPNVASLKVTESAPPVSQESAMGWPTRAAGGVAVKVSMTGSTVTEAVRVRRGRPAPGSALKV